MPPPLRATQPRLPLPAWLKPIRWEAETAAEWYATVAGRGCRVDLTRQVLFDPGSEVSHMYYTEDTLVSRDASDFCIDHSDDPAVHKNIHMRFQVTLSPKQDGTIFVNGTLKDPCKHCSLPAYFPSPAISGTITRRTDREFWLAISGAVHGGFAMKPVN
jgi:hypothetical protein